MITYSLNEIDNCMSLNLRASENQLVIDFNLLCSPNNTWTIYGWLLQYKMLTSFEQIYMKFTFVHCCWYTIQVETSSWNFRIFLFVLPWFDPSVINETTFFIYCVKGRDLYCKLCNTLKLTGGWWTTCSATNFVTLPSLCFHSQKNCSPIIGLYGFEASIPFLGILCQVESAQASTLRNRCSGSVSCVNLL